MWRIEICAEHSHLLIPVGMCPCILYLSFSPLREPVSYFLMEKKKDKREEEEVEE